MIGNRSLGRRDRSCWSNGHSFVGAGLAILQQHDRCAFADLFLRRGLALLRLGGLALGLLLVLPAVPAASTSGSASPQGLVLWLVLWMAVAVSYPTLQRIAGRVVDRFVLQRPDHAALRGHIAQAVAQAQDLPALFRTLANELGTAFRTADVSHAVMDGPTPTHGPMVLLGHDELAALPPTERPAAGVAAVALIPTVEAPLGVSSTARTPGTRLFAPLMRDA